MPKVYMWQNGCETIIHNEETGVSLTSIPCEDGGKFSKIDCCQEHIDAARNHAKTLQPATGEEREFALKQLRRFYN